MPAREDGASIISHKGTKKLAGADQALFPSTVRRTALLEEKAPAISSCLCAFVRNEKAQRPQTGRTIDALFRQAVCA